MKKIYFLLLAMIVSFAAQAWTVAFTNPDGWDKVCVHAWNNAGNVTGNWPGKEMTKRGDVWVYTSAENAGIPTGIIFNNGDNGKQTSDLTYVGEGTYSKTGRISSEPVEPLEPEVEDPDPYDPSHTTVVYFENTGNWGEVYAYNWQSSSSTNVNHAWPGVSINANTREFPVKGSDETKTLYYYTVTNAQWNNIIFNNGGGSQTGDLKVVNAAVYNGTDNIKGDAGHLQAVGNIVDGEYVPADYVEPATAKIYFPVQTFNVPQAYFYSWGPELTPAYPGTKLEKETIQDTECWVFSVSSEKIDGVLIDCIQLNIGNDSRKPELKNIELKDGDVIDIQTGIIGNIEEGFNLGEYDPNAPVYYLVGTIFEDNDEGQDIRKALTDETATEDYWTYTGNVVPGIFYILKVQNGEETKYVASDEPHITGACVVDCVVAGSNDASEEFNFNAQGTYTFVFNPEAMTLTATVEGEVEPVNYATWDVEVRGQFNSWGENVKHPNAQGLVTFTNQEIGNGEFKIVLRNGTSPQEWLSTGGAVPMDEEVVLYHENANMTIEGATADQKFNVTIDVKHNRMTIIDPTTTGIENIVNDAVEAIDENAPVEYFNLQGVRVENPVSGLYIRRQGNKATKVLVK